MGKYDAVIKGLPAVPLSLLEGGSKYQARIEEMKADENLSREATFDQVKILVESLWDLLNRYKLSPTPEGRLSLLALEYRLLYDVEEAAENVAKAVRLRMEARSQLLLDQMEDEGTTSLTLADGAKLREQPEPYCTTRDEDPEKALENEKKLREWFISEGLETMLKPHASTVNSLTKERLLNGEAPPAGVSIYMKSKLVLTR